MGMAWLEVGSGGKHMAGGHGGGGGASVFYVFSTTHFFVGLKPTLFVCQHAVMWYQL